MPLRDPNKPHEVDSADWVRQNQRFTDKVRNSGVPAGSPVPAGQRGHRARAPWADAGCFAAGAPI